MRPSRYTLAAIVMTGFSSASEDAAMPDAPRVARSERGPAIRTEHEAYKATVSEGWVTLTISLHYENRAGVPRYMPTCRQVPPSPALEKLVDGKWVPVYSNIDPSCLDAAPIIIAPGRSYSYAFEVHGSRIPNTGPGWRDGDVAGTYCVRWQMFETWEHLDHAPWLGRHAPPDEFISNTFRIEK